MIAYYSNDVSRFIESSADHIDENGESWYWFPVYYKKVREGVFIASQFKDTKSGLTHIVEQIEKRNPDD